MYREFVNITWSEITCFSNKTKGCNSTASSRKNCWNFRWTHRPICSFPWNSSLNVANIGRNNSCCSVLRTVSKLKNIQGFLLHWKLGQGNLKTQSCPIQSPMIFASCPPGSPACAIFGNMKSESMLVRKKLSVNFGSWFLSCLSWVLKSDCFRLQENCQHVRDSGRFATHPNVDDKPQINPYLLGMKGLRCDNA